MEAILFPDLGRPGKRSASIKRNMELKIFVNMDPKIFDNMDLKIFQNVELNYLNEISTVVPPTLRSDQFLFHS